MSVLTRTTTGLIYKTDFVSASGWTNSSPSPFAFGASTAPIYCSFDPIPYTLDWVAATLYAGGIREVGRFIEGSTDTILVGAGAGPGGAAPDQPWRIQMFQRAVGAAAYTYTGVLDIELQKGTGGNYAARDQLFFGKFGSTYYVYAMGAGTVTGGGRVPGFVYNSQLWTNSALTLNGWVYDSSQADAGLITGDTNTDCTGNVVYDGPTGGTTWHQFTSISASTYGVGHFTGSTAKGPWTPAGTPNPIVSAGTTIGIENPKVFYSAALGAYVMFVTHFIGSGNSFQNTVFTSPDCNTWSPSFANCTIINHQSLLHDSVLGPNIFAPTYDVSNAISQDSLGNICCTYDGDPHGAFGGDIAQGHKAFFGVAEPAPNALDCNGAGIYYKTLFPVPPLSVGNLSGQDNWSQVLGATQVQVVSNGNINMGTNPEDDIVVNTGFTAADATAIVAVTYPSTTVSVGVIARYVSSTNFLLVDFAVTGGNNLQVTVYYRNGGGYQLLNNTGAIGGTTGSGAHTFQVNMVGNVYKVYIDGVLQMTYTDNTSGYTAAGEWGLRNGAGGTGARTVNSYSVVANSSATARRTLTNGDFYAEFAFEFKAGATGAGGFDFRVQDASNYYRLVITEGSGIKVQKVVSGTPTDLAVVGGTTQVTTPLYVHYIKLSAVGTAITATLDGELQVNTTDATYASGTLIGFYGDGTAAYRARLLSMTKGQTVVINSFTNGNTVNLCTPGESPGYIANSQTVASGSATFTWPHYPMGYVNDFTGGITYAAYNGDVQIWGGDVFSLGAALAAGSISETAHTTTTLSFTATNSSGGVTPYAYQWAYRVHNTGGYVNTGTNSLSLAQTGLAPGTAYDFRLTYTDAGSGSVQAFLLNVSTDSTGNPPSGNALLGGMADMTGGFD